MKKTYWVVNEAEQSRGLFRIFATYEEALALVIHMGSLSETDAKYTFIGV